MKKIIAFFTSLRLMVVLLAFSIILVFVGTLAQADEGLYGAQAHYFKQWVVIGANLFGHKIPLLLPGGYLLGTLLLVNLVAAHIYRFQLTPKKIGIQLAHAGVIVLLVGQLSTDMFSRELQMHFDEGQTRNYSDSANDYELIFRSGDTITAIPEKLLRPGTGLEVTNLPFAIIVKTNWHNSDVSFRAPMVQNGPPLTPNGIAANFDFSKVEDVKTTDERNVPTALLEFRTPSGSLGTWVVSDWAGDPALVTTIRRGYAQMGAMAQKIGDQLVAPQSIMVDGKPYTFTMRPARVIHPFSLTLLKATHTVYPGTISASEPEGIPKDFRSRVRIDNRQTGEQREVEISMNHPLRYGGYTFYQFQMDAGQLADQAGRAPDIRAVSREESELVDALHRMRDGGSGTGFPVHVSFDRLCHQTKKEMKKIYQKWFPPLLMFVMALWFFGNIQASKDKDFAFSEFGQLPVTANGRIEPMDSLARNSLLEIREKQTLNAEPWKDWYQNPKMISATEWLANVLMNPEVADDWPVFRVDNPDLISLLKLPDRDPEKKLDGKHYSWNQIQPMLDVFSKEHERVQKVESANRTAYENAIIKMEERLMLYASLRNAVEPAGAQNWPEELAAYQTFIPDGVAAVQAQQANQPYDQTNFNVFAAYIQEFQFMAAVQPPLVLPPTGSSTLWRRMGDALLDMPRSKTPVVDDSMHDYARMTGGLAANQPEEFNAAVRDLRTLIANSQPKAVAKAKAEVFFNQMEPFYNAMVIYVLAGLLGFFYWFNLSEPLRRAAVWLLWLAFAIHTTGLVYRMVLEGRPPVTNLYSSAIFIGWGACLLGLILERFFKNGIGAVTSAGVGFITLIIAHHLALSGDTMEMMRAVLDTNFWLATHVVAVTTGYASTFVAGFLGLLYVILGVFTPNLTRKMSKTEASIAGTAAAFLVKAKSNDSLIATSLGTAKQVSEAAEKGLLGKSITRMIYGIVCFATLFSFVGTVLGGIWADQSWGRFWGWDPKENGALIIVLWNALILHLRWGGIIRERGLAVCAIGGNIVTSWSWFGVNMLGIGLHSYGFTEAAFKWLVLFVASQFAFIALGLLPARMWKSYNARTVSPTPIGLKPKGAH